MPKAVQPLATYLKFQGYREFPPESELEEKDDWGLTLDQQETYVEQFRRILVAKNAWRDDEHEYYTARRYLRARNYDLEKATKMWLDSLAWRKSFGADGIITDFHFPEKSAFLKSFPQGWHKVDKQGRPVYVQILGKLNVPELMTITTEERLLKFHVQEYERANKVILPVCSKAHGRNIDCTMSIMDVKGTGMGHFTSDVRRLLAIITKIDGDNFPESLGHVCVINAPNVFRMVWAIVKPSLDARTQSKVEILGSNYKEALLKWVDEENLLEYMGGKSKGTLEDDIGPWSDPDTLARLGIDLESLRRGKRSQAQLMSQSSLQRLRSISQVQSPQMVQLRAPSGAVSFNSAVTAGVVAGVASAGQVKLPVDGSGRLGAVVEDAFHSPRGHSSEAPRTVHIHAPGDDLPTPPAGGPAVAAPNVSNGNGTTLASLSALVAMDKPRTIVERIQALEKLMPGQLERLKAAGAVNVQHSAAMSTRSAPEGSLLHRVETLEDALNTLLAAQELEIQREQAESALKQMHDQPHPSNLCGCCSIM